MSSFGVDGAKIVILLIFCEAANSRGDSSRRIVWLGRRPIEKISTGPNDKLIQVGNLEQSAKANAYLTVFRKARNAEMKVGLSEPWIDFNGLP